jgi:hypothetical protein
LTGWTAGCVQLVSEVFAHPSVQPILVTVPFLTSWVAVCFLLVGMVFGVERVRLGLGGLEYQVVALVPLSRRWIPRTELKGVRADLTAYQVNERDLACLKFQTLGQPVCFARGISEEEQKWLVERLNRYLETLPLPESPKPEQADAIDDREPGRGEWLQPAASPLQPPSDSRIDILPDVDTIAFAWQGRWSPAAIGATTFLHLFWNGIVSVFIVQLIQDFQWGLFFFLIPFEMMGLVFCGVWILALTAPAWRWTWTFGEQEITKRLNVSDADGVFVNFAWSKRIDVPPLVGFELRRREEQNGTVSSWALFSHPDGECTLSLLGEEGNEVLAIKALTEGDARWIADVLLRAFPSWSSNDRSRPSQ